jgi:phosphoglycolate phosphatase
MLSAEDLGYKVPSRDSAADIIGLGLSEAVKTLFPLLCDADVERFVKRYSLNFRARDQTPSKLFPQVAEVLASLKDADYLISVATGKSRAGLNRVLSALNMADIFDGSRCADETISKPDPLMLHELLNQFELAPDEALMVGDTEFDLDMAHRAGVPSIGVSYGAHSKDRLLQYNSVAIIDEFIHLKNYILQ